MPACCAALSRFVGPKAEELTILCRPLAAEQSPRNSAEAVYRSLVDALARWHGSFGNLSRETLFIRDARQELPAILEARQRILSGANQTTSVLAPGCIQQAPIESNAIFELLVSVVLPHDRTSASVRDVRAIPSCPCAACASSTARLIRLDGETSLYTNLIYGRGRDAFSEALDMFSNAEQLLTRCGMGFSRVVRTWIYLRDIDRDYDALNRARREFFQSRGIELQPASTGVQGVPPSGAHDFSMSLYALDAPLAVAPVRMSASTLNEAWSYGADFSRGLKISGSNKLSLQVSGTASIDAAGHSVHIGDFNQQALRMLKNIEALLAAQGAGFPDVHSAITYLKNPDDAVSLRKICHSHGFGGFPWVVVEAPLCRPELLCETEVVALLPIGAMGA